MENQINIVEEALKEYGNLLDRMPAEESEEWWGWLIDNNTVVYEGKYWILIENVKYHELTNPHYTLFPKDFCETETELSSKELKERSHILDKYHGWYYYRNGVDFREGRGVTLRRLHYHIVKIIDINPHIKGTSF